MTNTFTITVPIWYWWSDLRHIDDEFITFSFNDEDTVNMYCHETADELIQGMSANDLVEWFGVDPEFVVSTNREDLM